MNSFFQRLHADFGWASLSYLFIGFGQIFFSAILEGGMAALFIFLAFISAMMTRLYKGKTYQEIVNARPGHAMPWRRRTEQMVSCGVLMAVAALTGSSVEAPLSGFALASAVCFALAGSFAMNDTSETEPVKGAGPSGPTPPSSGPDEPK